MTARALALGHRMPARNLLAAGAVSALLVLGVCVPLALLLRAGSDTGQRPVAGAAASVRRGSTALPAGVLERLSSALGAARASYFVRGQPGAASAGNAAQRLQARFSPSGAVHVRSGGASVALRLRGFGYEGRLTPAGAPRMRASENRLSYLRPAIEESYVNGPAGLEQGFVLEHAPRGAGAAANLTLALALAGSSRASITRGGTSVSFGSARGSLTYGDLQARDASGRSLPSWLTLDGKTLALHVRLAGARFPVTIDPLLSGAEGELELERDGDAESGSPFKGELFGTSVALSGDGNTALVGAPGEKGGPGKAWVFVRTGATWSQQQELTEPAGVTAENKKNCEPPAEPKGCLEFGKSVALSGNGGVLLVGAPPVHSGSGMAFLYSRDGSPGAWTLTAQLQIPGASVTPEYGRSVAVAENGETVLVGAPQALQGIGEAWSYSLEGGTWSSVGEPLEVTEQQHRARFGESVALSSDGAEAVVGAPEEHAPAVEGKAGAAFIFGHGSAGWQQEHELTGAGESGEGQFGASVAISANGATVLVGAPEDSGLAEHAGAAWLFTLEHGSVTQTQMRLTGGDSETAQASGEEFGAAVALAADGASAIVGAPGANGPAHMTDDVGTAWVFSLGESGWGAPVQITYATEANSAGRFGAGVGIDSDGQTVLVGSPHSYEKEGDAWLFGARPQITSLLPARGPQRGGTEVTIEGINFEEVTAVRFGQTPAASFKPVPLDPGKIEAISPPGEGEVKVTVETQGWLSPPETTSDQFTYGEGSGGGGGGGERKSKGSGSQPGASPQSPSTPLPTAVVIPSEQKFGVLGTSSRSKPCAVRSKSSTVGVGSSSRAAVTLLASGRGRCAGRLTLRAQVRSGGRPHTKTLGSTGYSVLAGHSERLTVKLDALARTLLRANHGRLKATLLIVRSEPSPPKALTASVTLARRS